MAEPNGNGHRGGMLAAVLDTIRTLPPAFILLLLLNALFLAALIWYVDARAKHSVDIIQQLLQACLRTGR